MAPNPEWMGFIAVPLTVSAAITIYVLVFDPDAQAPVFLFMFYFVAGVAGALGSLLGRAIGRRRLL
jgi:CDP-diglyceride synthetase